MRTEVVLIIIVFSKPNFDIDRPLKRISIHVKNVGNFAANSSASMQINICLSEPVRTYTM